MQGARNGAENGGLLALVGQPFAGVEGTATVRELDHDGGLDIAGTLERRVDRARGRAVDARDGELLLLRILEQRVQLLARHNTGAAHIEDTHGKRRKG